MLRASEALMAGSSLMQATPYTTGKSGDAGCALGMISEANHGDRHDAQHFYPWLGRHEPSVPCGCHLQPYEKVAYDHLVAHLFNEHVMLGVIPACAPPYTRRHDPHPEAYAHPWTLEQLADWLESVDPTPKESKEEVTDRQHREMSPIGDAALLADSR